VAPTQPEGDVSSAIRRVGMPKRLVVRLEWWTPGLRCGCSRGRCVERG
jgi:hypothetical protein